MKITTEKTAYIPEELGYDSGNLEAVNDFFAYHTERGVLRGANYAILREGKTLAAASMGKLSYAENDVREITIDTIYPICSETKLFTATAMFKLLELGKIRMSQPIGDFIEEFKEPPFDAVTIAQLLSHTSGFAIDPHAITYDKPHHYQLIHEAFSRGDKDWIKASMGVGLHFKPGSEWGYSTFGYSIAAEVVKRVSGMTEKEFIKKYIFDPCEMLDTCYGIPADKLDRLIVNDKEQADEIEAVRNNVQPTEEWLLWESIPCGGSGIYSTTSDLMKFASMLINGGVYNGRRVLGKMTVEKLGSVYTENTILDKCWGNPVGYYRRYGLGPDKRWNEDCLYSSETFYHEGAGRCALIVDPREKLAAAFLIPYTAPDLWDADPIWNAPNVIWGGLMR